MLLVQAKNPGLTTIRAKNAVSRKKSGSGLHPDRSLDAIRRPGLHKYQKRLTSQDSV